MQVGVVFCYGCKQVGVVVQVFYVVVGEICVDQVVGQFVVVCDVDVVVVQECVGVFGSGEELVVCWVVYYGLGDDVMLYQCDGYVVLWEVVDEVCGVVEWVDYLDVFVDCFVVGLGLVGFFCQNCVIGVGSFDDFDDCCFGCVVDFGNEIVVLFVFGVQVIDVEGCVVDDGVGFVSSLDGDIEYWMYVGFLCLVC